MSLEKITYQLQSKLPVVGKVSRRARLMLGYSCNLKCLFCYYANLRGWRTFEEILSEIKVLKEAGIDHFDCTGGEPTLYPHFLRIINTACDLNCKISCVSNGWKFADINFAKKCAKLHDVLISIHGTKHHDTITGIDGSFAHATQAVKNLQKLNIKVRVNYTLCSENFEDLPEFIDLMNILRPAQVNFIFLNYNDAAKDFAGISLLKIAERLNTFLPNLEVPCNIRYVPYCLIRQNFRYCVKNYYDHIFDCDDWAPLYSYYNCIDRLSDVQIVRRTTDLFAQTLPAKYKKFKQCFKCKYFIKCDGFKNTDFENMKRLNWVPPLD